jgi:hypothetical protein
VQTGAIDINDGKTKVVGAEREGGSDGEIINGVVKQLKKPVVPSRENSPGRTRSRFKHERTKGLR